MMVMSEDSIIGHYVEWFQNELAHQSKLASVPHSLSWMLAKSIDEVRQRYKIEGPEFMEVLKSTGIEVVFDAQAAEKTFGEDKLFTILEKLCARVLQLPAERIPPEMGRRPWERFAEELFLHCGDWLRAIRFFPYRYPTCYFNLEKQVNLQFEWDSYDVQLFAYLGIPALIPDIVPRIRAVPLWCYEQPMQKVLGDDNWHVGALQDWGNLKRVLGDIWKHYEQVAPLAYERFQSHLKRST